MNREPYFWIDVSDSPVNKGQHGHFSIRAPEKPGFYEFFAFVAPNPMGVNTGYNFFPLELHRFTLEVID